MSRRSRGATAARFSDAASGYAASSACAREANDPAASDEAETSAPERNRSRRVKSDMKNLSLEMLPVENEHYKTAQALIQTLHCVLRMLRGAQVKMRTPRLTGT